MKRMPLSRLFALPLALTLLLSPAAQALTPNQARELLQDYYIDEVPEDVLDQNTIQAMLEALGDPYTTYFSPEEYGAFTGSMSDTDTVGVGIYSLVTADGPLIQRVYENTPAADAGLQPGDLVTAVDGRSTAGQDAGTVAAWLKGDLPLRRRSLYPAELQAHMKLWKNWRADALILYPNSPRLSTARGVFVPRFGRFFCKISCARYCSTV